MRSEKCFGLDEKGKCQVLNVGKCWQMESCVFYKTKWQFDKDADDAFHKNKRKGVDLSKYEGVK